MKKLKIHSLPFVRPSSCMAHTDDDDLLNSITGNLKPEEMLELTALAK